MDYKRVLRLHFVNHLSGREIAESCGDCSKTTVNEFLKRFRENPELSYPLPADVTNEYIEGLLYKKPGVSADQLLYRDFNKEAVYKALARKGETLKHLWQKYNAIGVVDGKKPMNYRQYCRRYSEWADSKQQMCIRDRDHIATCCIKIFYMYCIGRLFILFHGSLLVLEIC